MLIGAVEPLTKARELITDPKKWIKGEEAMNADGEPVDPELEQACYFCAQGAVVHVAGTGKLMKQCLNILSSLALMYRREGDNKLVAFNDHPDTHHADVLRIFDLAIDKAKKI